MDEKNPRVHGADVPSGGLKTIIALFRGPGNQGLDACDVFEV
jgi:hypothetical protein